MHQEMETCINVITMAKSELIILKHSLSLPPTHPLPRDIYFIPQTNTANMDFTRRNGVNGVTYKTVSPSP